MASSDLIQFKRGTQANLNTLMSNKQGIDGCFYLTINDDSVSSPAKTKASRLYVGRADGTIVPVNQGIVTVAKKEDLSTLTANHSFSAGDFAYVEEGNILAVYSNNQWIQINYSVDEYVDGMSSEVSVTGNTATVTTKASQHASKLDLPTSFTITTAGGITVSGTGTALTLTGDEYDLTSTTVANNKASITLSSDTRQNAGSVEIEGGANITLSSTAAGKLKIAATDNQVSSVTIDTGDHNANPNVTGFRVNVTNSESAITESGSIDPVINYGTSGTEQAKFISGAATLNVYSKTDIDNKLTTVLNPMTYRGSIGANQAGAVFASPNEDNMNVSIGDVFRIVGSGLTLSSTRSSSGSAIQLDDGDILIAKGTEDPTTGYITSSTLQFDYIPSGDDIDHTYAVGSVTNGISILDTTGAQSVKIGSVAVAAGTAMTVSESGTSDKTITVNHGTVTRSNTTATGVNNQDSGSITFNAVTGVASDEQEHITGVTTTPVTVESRAEKIESVGYSASSATSNNVTNITVTGTVTMKDAFSNITGVGQTKSGTFTLASENLSLSVSGANNNIITANYVWGTF